MINHDTEAMRDTIRHIEREWPEITDVVACARYVLRNEDKDEIDVLCGFWSRHNPCY